MHFINSLYRQSQPEKSNEQLISIKTINQKLSKEIYIFWTVFLYNNNTMIEFTEKYRCQNCNHNFTVTTFENFRPEMLRCPKCGSYKIQNINDLSLLKKLFNKKK